MKAEQQNSIDFQELLKIDGLEQVEGKILSCFNSEASLLTEIPSYLLKIGGKRIRPIFALLSARACGLKEPSTDLISFSAGLEIIHMATLMHDDIIDHSPLRRHQETPYLKFGLENTLLAGDFLLVKGFGLCIQLDKFIGTNAELACQELVEGEILEAPLHLESHTLNSALNIADKKTAALFWLAARGGAFLAQAPSVAIEAMSSFGRNLGIAFQIADDILDVDSKEESTGKRIGTDILERKPSVVNVIWLDKDTQLGKTILQPEATIDDTYVNEVIAEMHEIGVIKEAKDLADEFTRNSLNALQSARANLNQPNEKTFLLLEALIAFAKERIG